MFVDLVMLRASWERDLRYYGTRDLQSSIRQSWVHALRVLEGMPEHAREKHFDMSMWATKTDCGTVGCVAGQCALDDWFIRNRASFIYEDPHSTTGYYTDPLVAMQVFGNIGYVGVLTHPTLARSGTTHADMVLVVKNFLDWMAEVMGRGATL